MLLFYYIDFLSQYLEAFLFRLTRIVLSPYAVRGYVAAARPVVVSRYAVSTYVDYYVCIKKDPGRPLPGSIRSTSKVLG